MLTTEPLPALCPTSYRNFARVGDWLSAGIRDRERPLVVGVGGPGGCGKSTFSRWLYHNYPEIALLSLDDFRLPRRTRRLHGRYGSHPEGNDLPRLQAALEAARSGRAVEQPVFDGKTGRVTDTVELPPARLLLADGELAAHEHMRGYFDYLVLVRAHWRTQLNTRLTRDMRERGCSLEKAIDIFLQSNLRDYPAHVVDSEQADVLLYRNGKNTFTLKRLGRAEGGGRK